MYLRVRLVFTFLGAMQMIFFFLPLALLEGWGCKNFQMLLMCVNMATMTTAAGMRSMEVNANKCCDMRRENGSQHTRYKYQLQKHPRYTFFDVERQYDTVARTDV